jgi:hypothetical protein
MTHVRRTEASPEGFQPDVAKWDAWSPEEARRLLAGVKAWIEQRFPKPCVAGSIPAGGTNVCQGAPTPCWLINAQHLRNVPGRKTDVAMPHGSATLWDTPSALLAKVMVMGVSAGAAGDRTESCGKSLCARWIRPLLLPLLLSPLASLVIAPGTGNAGTTGGKIAFSLLDRGRGGRLRIGDRGALEPAPPPPGQALLLHQTGHPLGAGGHASRRRTAWTRGAP